MWPGGAEGIRSRPPGRGRWQTQVDDVGVVKNSYLTNAHLFKFQVVEKTHSSATLSMTHEGRLFLDLRAPRDPLVRVQHAPCLQFLCLGVFVLIIWDFNIILNIVNMWSKPDDKQLKSSSRWRLMELIWILMSYIQVLQALKVQWDLLVHRDKMYANQSFC